MRTTQAFIPLGRRNHQAPRPHRPGGATPQFARDAGKRSTGQILALDGGVSAS